MSTAKTHPLRVNGSSTAEAARLAIEILQSSPEVTWTAAHLSGLKNTLEVTGYDQVNNLRSLEVTPVCCGIIDVQTRDTARILTEFSVFGDADAILDTISRPTPDVVHPRHSVYEFTRVIRKTAHES